MALASLRLHLAGIPGVTLRSAAITRIFPRTDSVADPVVCSVW
jgi:hypothetical protein